MSEVGRRRRRLAREQADGGERLVAEHLTAGGAREGAVACSATLLFTEDVGGSEILYLEVDGVPMSTVLGSGSEALAAIGSGSVDIAVDPTSFVLFDPVSRTRVGQGVQHG